MKVVWTRDESQRQNPAGTARPSLTSAVTLRPVGAGGDHACVLRPPGQQEAGTHPRAARAAPWRCSGPARPASLPHGHQHAENVTGLHPTAPCRRRLSPRPPAP